MRHIYFALLCLIATNLPAQTPDKQDTFLIRIYFQNAAEADSIKQYNFIIESEKRGEYVETRVPLAEMFKLITLGFDVSLVLEQVESALIDSAYHSPEEIEAKLNKYCENYSEICVLKTIGQSTTLKLPIWAIKISDRAKMDEDEPRILLTGAHHGREPLSVEICLYLINQFCTKYRSHPDFKKWIDNFEIWIVPVVNPDGFSQIFDSTKNLTWWRKNLRDNNRNGIFDPEIDGVDINRNYNFNWELGGSDESSSQFYRGIAPFSENETRAIKNLVEDKRFCLILDFHSFGESVLYPWGNQTDPPDLPLILEIAYGLASKIKKIGSIKSYDVIPLDAKMGQSSVWHYGVHGIMGFIVETGDTYLPPGKQINTIASQVSNGVYFALDRLSRARLSGHVWDGKNKMPLAAQIQIRKQDGARLQSVTSEARWGRFDRLLSPGKYEITVLCPGFHEFVIESVEIAADMPASIEVYLTPEPASEEAKRR